MKKLLIIGLLLSTFTMNAQDYKKLLLTVKTSIDKKKAIYIEPIDNDRLLVVDYLKNSLSANGFKIVTEKKDAVYVVTISYKHRIDTGCGGRVIKYLNGQIIDAKNNAEIVATFSFSQGSFEGKCASDIMSALAKKINEGALKK